jgi:hypothetical protein
VLRLNRCHVLAHEQHRSSSLTKYLASCQWLFELGITHGGTSSITKISGSRKSRYGKASLTVIPLLAGVSMYVRVSRSR